MNSCISYKEGTVHRAVFFKLIGFIREDLYQVVQAGAQSPEHLGEPRGHVLKEIGEVIDAFHVQVELLDVVSIYVLPAFEHFLGLVE